MKNLFEKVLSLMQTVEGQNNYVQSFLRIETCEKGFTVESCCLNEYGSSWWNEDEQFISWENTPNWVMNLLWAGVPEKITLYEGENILYVRSMEEWEL